MECDSGNEQPVTFPDQICTGGYSGDEQQVAFPDHICTGGIGMWQMLLTVR